MSKEPESAWALAMRNFIEQATDCALKSGEPAQIFLRPRTPHFDSGFDARFMQLGAYQIAADALNDLASVKRMYGAAGSRLALELLYAYFAATPSLELHRPTLDSVLGQGQEELAMANWRHLGFGILQCFHTELAVLQIAPDVMVCLRTPQAMPAGITNEHLEWLQEDVTHGAFGHYALVAEHLEPKTPKNIINGDSFHTFGKMHRTMLAMRLLKAGAVGTGRWYSIRPAHLPANLPGQSSNGETRSRHGADYTLVADDLPHLRSLYALLFDFEINHQKKWKNISVALRRFSDIYDNDQLRPDDQVIDAMIAVEALVGTSQEIAYRLSSRVAGILSDSDDVRIQVYELVKDYYKVRSTLVHGGDLEEKESAMLTNNDELLGVLRRMLVAFLRLATGQSRFNSRRAVEHALDGMLLSTAIRHELRQSMGLG